MQKILLLLCFCSQTIFAQNNALDSLERLLSVAPDNAQRLELFSQLTNQAFRSDLHMALLYAQRGLDLAEKTGDKTWQPKFCEMSGRMYANLLQFDSAMLFFDRATSGYAAIADAKGQASTAFKKAWVYKQRNELTKAAEADLQALRLMESIADQEGVANALARVAEDLRLQGRGKEAMQYAQRSIDMAEKNGFQQQLVHSLREAGVVCGFLYNYEQSLYYFEKALSQAHALNFSAIEIAGLLNDRGNALKRLKRYPEAIANYQECLELGTIFNLDMLKSSGYANLGEVYMLMGRYTDALPYQLKTIGIQEQNQDLYNLVETYTHISTTYENLNDYASALSYERKARQLRDSTLNIESDAKISELHTQYETEKKEATIAIQQAQISRQRIIGALGFGIAVLLALLAYVFRKNAVARKKANAQLATKNAENELLLKEIHHRVKNNLEVVSSLLALQSAQIDDPGVKDAMQEGRNRVQSIGIVHQKLYQRDNLAAIEMRDYFLNLSESVLDTFGAEHRIRVECIMQELELDVDTAVPLGLIVNELLVNALKYAFPDNREGQVRIQLVKQPDGILHLEVADNGVGKVDQAQGTGFGKQLVSLLTRQLNGSMQEEVKNGVTIRFDFNLKKAA
ncbi:MAG: tetratricopeptide repeat protein [Saprospiraceae bacterium]|nr:tetratricopeptide repeat protein [Saprospiraceae bacterium]